MFTYYNTYILQVYHSELLVTSSSLPSSLSSGCADCSGVHSLNDDHGDDHDYCDDRDNDHDIHVYDCNCFDKSQPEKKLEKIMRHFPPSLNPHLQICDILKRVLDLKR